MQLSKAKVQRNTRDGHLVGRYDRQCAVHREVNKTGQQYAAMLASNGNCLLFTTDYGRLVCWTYRVQDRANTALGRDTDRGRTFGQRESDFPVHTAHSALTAMVRPSEKWPIEMQSDKVCAQ